MRLKDVMPKQNKSKDKILKIKKVNGCSPFLPQIYHKLNLLSYGETNITELFSNN